MVSLMNLMKSSKKLDKTLSAPCEDIKKKDSTHDCDCAYPQFYTKKSKVGLAFVTEKHPESGEIIPISVTQKPEELVNKENTGLVFPISDNSINEKMVLISVADLPTCDQYLTGSWLPTRLH